MQQESLRQLADKVGSTWAELPRSSADELCCQVHLNVAFGSAITAANLSNAAFHVSIHSGGGSICAAGCAPASFRPLPARRLMARTVMSWSQRIWQLNRMPVRLRA